MWMFGCDIRGGYNIGNEKTSRDECEEQCLTTLGCTHFSWSNGVCYKKSGLTNRNKAYVRAHFVCGIMDSC